MSEKKDAPVARTIGTIVGGEVGRIAGEASGVPGGGVIGGAVGGVVGGKAGEFVANMPPSDDPGMREHFSRRCGR